ncbi:MAG TPA: hypothetical protein VFG54_12135 [Prolixibacteraceae bacterium]|nr:hypothetical protein [Prolixibacteraceae bacterium]
MLEPVIKSQSGTAKVSEVPVNFSASEAEVSVNASINLSVNLNRSTKKVTFANYGVAQFPDTMTLGEVKAAMEAAAVELDSTL